jgi:hypothetical protein
MEVLPYTHKPLLSSVILRAYGDDETWSLSPREEHRLVVIKSKEDEIDGTCSTNAGDEESIHIFSRKS